MMGTLLLAIKMQRLDFFLHYCTKNETIARLQEAQTKNLKILKNYAYSILYALRYTAAATAKYGHCKFKSAIGNQLPKPNPRPNYVFLLV